MDSYGVWDLIYRYLLPDWWIIPVYTTVTAWIATVAWWRRAAGLGSAWARRLIEDGPAARRLAVRIVAAVPFFLVPPAVVAMWYVLSSSVWADFHGDNDIALAPAPNVVNVLAAVYAAAGILFAARSDDEGIRWLVALGFALVVSVPLVVLGTLSLLLGLLIALGGALRSTADWSLALASLNVVAAGLLILAAFWAAGWTARRGIELLTGPSGQRHRSAVASGS